MPPPSHTSNWPAIEAEHWNLPPTWRSGTRFVSSNNLFLLEKGSLHYHDISTSQTLRPHALLFVPRGVRHSLLPGPAGFSLTLLRLRLSAFGLHIEADAQAWDLLMALTRFVHAHSPVLKLPPADLSQLRDHLSGILQAQNSPSPARLCRIKASALNIIANLASALPRNFDPPTYPAVSFARIRSVIEFIELHFQNPITISQLASLAQLNRSRFHAVFKSHTGLSPVEYLTRVRIGEACRQLRDSSDPLLSIALKSGFSSSSRFYEAFHQIVGQSPARWRKRYLPATR